MVEQRISNLTRQSTPENWTQGLGSSFLNNTLADLYDDDVTEMFPVYMRATVTLFCVLVLVIGVCGNLLVPLVVWSNRDMRNSTNIFLVNLSIADLLILVTCVPTVLIEIHSRPEVWVIGEAMCKFVMIFF